MALFTYKKLEVLVISLCRCGHSPVVADNMLHIFNCHELLIVG
jgi:hypothetical protein